MAKTLAELLNEADDLELSAPDGSKVKMSELKGYRTASDNERRGYETKRQEAERLANEAKQVFDALSAAQKEFEKKSAPPPDTSKDNWRKNPLYEEIVSVIDEANRAASEARELAKNTKKELDNTSAIYALERMRREYAEANIKPKDRKFEDLVAEALQAKELDAMGLPTIGKVLNRLSEPERMETYAAEKVAAAQKEWEKKQRMSEVPKPGKFTTRKSTDAAPIKDLNQLTSELVMNDPDIQAAMETH